MPAVSQETKTADERMITRAASVESSGRQNKIRCVAVTKINFYDFIFIGQNKYCLLEKFVRFDF